jgi:hypothetical protein
MQTAPRSDYFDVDVCFVQYSLIDVQYIHTMTVRVTPILAESYAGYDSWTRLELNVTLLIHLVARRIAGCKSIIRCFLYYPYIRSDGTIVRRNYTLLPQDLAITRDVLELNRPNVYASRSNVYTSRTPVVDGRRCIGRLFVEVTVNDTSFVNSGEWSIHFLPNRLPYFIWNMNPANFIRVVAVDEPANLLTLHPNHGPEQIEYYTRTEEEIDMEAAANSNE